MINHISNLQIETYRGIKDLQIENLGSVNLFVGDNNSGKTSVLEAIQLLCSPTIYALTKIARKRETARTFARFNLNLLDSVLFTFNVTDCTKVNNHYSMSLGGTVENVSGNVTISGELIHQMINVNEIPLYSPLRRSKSQSDIENAQEEVSALIGTLENTFNSAAPQDFAINDYMPLSKGSSETGLLNVSFIQTIDHILDNSFQVLTRKKSIKDKAVELLKQFDETIIDIRNINDNIRSVPSIENLNGEYIPLSLYGDGMKKALTMLKAVVEAENGVALIDEFETALHTSAMKPVFKFILDAARTLNVQLFFTTHSLEAVDKLLESSTEHLDELNIIRLKKKDGITFAKATNGVDALEERAVYDMELRI